MATHSRILAWSTPWAEEPGGLQPLGLHRVRHHHTLKRVSQVAHVAKDPPARVREAPLGEGMAAHSKILAWRTPMDSGLHFLVGYRPWDRKDLDMTEAT